MYHFYKPVNDDQYQVVAVTFLFGWDWEADSKVHWQVLPPMSKNRQRLKIFVWLVADCLWSQTYIAAVNVGLDVPLQHWPIVLSGNQLASFFYAKVTYKIVVMIPAYQLWTDDFWNVRKTLVMEHLFNVFSAFRQSFWPQFHGLFIIIL